MGLLLLILACCSSGDLAQERARRATKSKGDIVVGAAASWETLAAEALWQGIQLAWEEINKKGGVLPRKLRIIKKDDKDTVTQGQLVAQYFAENMDLVAVIGHLVSYVSIPTSVMYDYNGILMLSPLSTNPELTGQGFELVFRNIPDDNIFGRRLADFSDSQGYKNMVVYHVDNIYGAGLATSFENRAEYLGISIRARHAYNSSGDIMTFRRDLAQWKRYYEYDAIFLAGTMPDAADFIKEARRMKETAPIVCGQALDSPALFKIAGDAVEKIFVASTFDPGDSRKEVRGFVERFRKRYGTSPPPAAAQGYDALNLLVYATEKAKSSNPVKVAAALRSVKNWPGVTGVTTFNAKGDVVNKPIFIKEAREGHFVHVLPGPSTVPESAGTK
jgi:branched-chain amino acid transport system substrate-binding protein